MEKQIEKPTAPEQGPKPEDRERSPSVEKEQIKQTPATESPGASTASPAAPTTPSPAVNDSRADDDPEQTVDRLVTTAFSDGLTRAIAEARKLNDAYVLDRFHDTLVNEFIEKLREEGEIRDV